MELKFGPWELVGYGGVLVYVIMYLIEYYYTEKKGGSYVPLSYWYLNLASGLLTLIYAIHIGNPVFVIGQAVGSSVVTYNLYRDLEKGYRSSPRALTRREEPSPMGGHP